MLSLVLVAVAALLIAFGLPVGLMLHQLSESKQSLSDTVENHKNRTAHHVLRGGFTMIELLVVIATIALMASLLVGATYRFVVGARESATRATIHKAAGIIQDRTQNFREKSFRNEADLFTTRWNLQSPKPAITMNIQLAEILTRKAIYKRDFPQCFYELDATQVTRWFGPSATVPPTNAEYKSRFESGIVLYALLMHGRTYGAQSVGQDDFRSSEIRNDLETGNLPCLVDAWGEPLRFYRWTTRLIRCGENGTGDYNGNGNATDPAGTINLTTGMIQASPAIRPTGTLIKLTPASLLISNLPPFDISSPYAKGPTQTDGILGGPSPSNTLGWPLSDDPESLNADPDDPTMRLASDWFSSPANAIAFVVGSELDVTNTFYVDYYHDPFTTTYTLIVSGGPDKTLGLYEPNDIPTFTNPQSINFGYLAAPVVPFDLDHIYDNITNLNQRH